LTPSVPKPYPIPMHINDPVHTVPKLNVQHSISKPYAFHFTLVTPYTSFNPGLSTWFWIWVCTKPAPTPANVIVNRPVGPCLVNTNDLYKVEK
jgi:hypothetical protein